MGCIHRIVCRYKLPSNTESSCDLQEICKYYEDGEKKPVVVKEKVRRSVKKAENATGTKSPKRAYTTSFDDMRIVRIRLRDYRRKGVLTENQI